MAELKNCPFCGSDFSFLSVIEYGKDIYAIRCCECGGESGSCETKEQAEEAWNRRENG